MKMENPRSAKSLTTMPAPSSRCASILLASGSTRFYSLSSDRYPLLLCSRSRKRTMTHEQQIRQQLAKALDWGEAHADFRSTVDGFPEDLRGVRPPGFS